MEKEDNFFSKGLSFFMICLIIVFAVGITVEVYGEIGWYVFLIEGGVASMFLLAKPTGKLITKIQKEND
ncbi:unnamed protein product [marine sediment metagenome]|uniref:Uncharacterized protein n=1 Tax=marine sediment metagenome TaxID=412755 RepID=X1CAH3_9ZZZZ